VLPEARVIFATDRLRQAEVTVVVPLHNYAQFIVQALDSVAAQTLQDLDLVVVDDASSDDSLAIASAWVQHHAARFNRVQLLQHAVNAGLGPTRNSAIAQAETPFALALDADDHLLAPACEKLLMAMHDGQADFVYPFVQQFGDGSAIMGQAPYSAQMLVGGNCISAIALIRKECWAAVGGYADMRQGWEDFDFWCKFVEMGMYGQQLPEVLAEYRVHGASMTHRITELPHNKQALMA
jgi:glycosyltransferase involved in cell wall biosynthesis